ncbi:hypothetical protein UA08_00582 [Talaromyces atroroseus]|uniref:D-isomer specific 2-hydroxyacid dehydrogenase NAD-binding domain-containing protein n=1 Tax=Talaromyces atroroseus TaxID=1441469 RepID=A0A225AUH0_TALAT|nr:hypothetical protein UA08_00582 [Talaromyces atroroseus]OKL64580.1 hypothetical protein UA08_00582 [Talaromyces atroroseus]
MAIHQTIVALETFFCPIPSLTSLPCPYTLHTYDRTAASEINERIAQATVLIVTTLPIRADALDVAVSPHLRAIAVVASGTNNIDLVACQQRGIVVMNSPGANTESVAQHALTLLLAARRMIIPMHVATMGLDEDGHERSQWERKGTLMNLLRDRKRKRLANMCQALGMRVQVSDRKNPPSQSTDRVSFQEVLRTSTAVVLCVPLTPSTENLISTEELKLMGEQALLINVSRGGVVDETALAEALKQGSIGGAATDVFAKEPASSASSPLLHADMRETNLTVSPHLAWLAQSTIENYQRVLVENLQGFLEEKPVNVVKTLA